MTNAETITKLETYTAEHRATIDGLISEIARYRKACGDDVNRFDCQQRIERLQDAVDREEDSYITAVNVLNDLRRRSL
jgi:hypothetical protein